MAPMTRLHAGTQAVPAHVRGGKIFLADHARRPGCSRLRRTARGIWLPPRIRVEKLDVFPDTASVGVEIERRQGN